MTALHLATYSKHKHTDTGKRAHITQAGHKNCDETITEARIQCSDLERVKSCKVSVKRYKTYNVLSLRQAMQPTALRTLPMSSYDIGNVQEFNSTVVMVSNIMVLELDQYLS